MLMSQPSRHLPAARPASAGGTRRGTRVRRVTMPRSFLVKTHSSHRVPNYRQLETQRGRGCRAPPAPVPGGRKGVTSRAERELDPGVDGLRAPHPLGGPRPRVGLSRRGFSPHLEKFLGPQSLWGSPPVAW